MDKMWPLVEAQHGAFARWQAAPHGIGPKQIARLERLGVVEIVTRNVLRVCGSPRTPEQALTIRVLDAGAGGVAARRGAGWLWSLPSFVPDALDVTRRRGAHGASESTSWPRLLPAHHVTVVRGIPVTTLARTFFDLAALPAYERRIGRLIDTVHGRCPSILNALHAMLPELAQRGRNGITVMRAVLATRPPGAVPLTGLERRFEHILTTAGLAVPRRQVDLGGHSWIGRVDYYDDPIRVIYEVDSILHHSSLSDRQNDALRDAAAKAAGFSEVVRIAEEHVWYEPHLVVRAVSTARQRYRRAA